MFLKWPKKSHFGRNVWKYSLMNTIQASFDTTVWQMTEMFQWPKSQRKWPKCLIEKYPAHKQQMNQNQRDNVKTSITVNFPLYKHKLFFSHMHLREIKRLFYVMLDAGGNVGFVCVALVDKEDVHHVDLELQLPEVGNVRKNMSCASSHCFRINRCWISRSKKRVLLSICRFKDKLFSHQSGADLVQMVWRSFALTNFTLKSHCT